MKSFLSSLRQIDRQASTSRHREHKLAASQTINNLSKSSIGQSRFGLGYLLRSASVIACTLGCQLFDVPKSLAAGVTVSGQVFSDVNSNGLIETGDSGIAGVTVVLRNTTTNTCQRVSTSSSGNYSFTSVSAGSYEIIEAGDQLNPTCTPAGGKTLAQTIGKDPTNYASTTPNVIPITVGISDVTAKNFGDHSANSLGNCPSPAYITQGTSTNNIKLNTVNLATGALSPIVGGDVLTNINGIGFSLVDGYIYGSQNTSGNFNLLRTGLDGKLENLGNILDVSGTTTLQGGSFVGDVDPNGIFYSIQGTTVTAIDVNPNSPTFKRYLRQFTIPNTVTTIQDIAISPIDGKVYTVSNGTTGTTGNPSRLYRYSDFSTISNGGTASIEDFGELRDIATNTIMASGAKGAIYFAADGTLYAYRNGNSGVTDGAIYALSTTNIATIPKFTTITTTAPGVGLNDGARCLFAPAVALPNTYTVSGTLYKDINNNGANNSEPGLGANVTVSIYDDKNSNNIIDANEQITTTTSDANGLYTLSNLVAGTYKIKVDTSDVDIPSNYSLSTSNNLSVTVGTASITGKDFGFVTPQVVGFKSAKLTDLNSDNKINPGETVTWTIDYVNTGLVDVTNFQITDVLPTGVTKSGTVTVAVGGTGQTTPTVNSSYTGTGTTDKLFNAPIVLKAGGMIKVTIPVTVGSGITGSLANQATATADNLPSIGIKTDNAGATTDLPATIQASPYSVMVPSGSVSQTITAAIDLTTITVAAEPTILPITTTPGICSISSASKFANTKWAAPFASGNSYPFTTNIPGYTNSVTYTNLSGTYDVDNNPYVYPQGYPYTTNSGPLNNVSIPFMGFAFDPIPGVDGINRYSFTTPLTSSDAILISDIDNLEEIELRFYDASGNILSTSGWTGESIKATSPNPTATIGSNYIRIVNPAGGTANLADPTWMLIPPAGQNVARVELSQINRLTSGDYAITFVHGGCISISGTVFNDTDSSKIQNGAEAGTNGGGLNAVLLNSSNAVVATTPVPATGIYSFSSVAPATYTVLITTGTNATVTLPTNWVSTGENRNGIADTTVDSKLLNIVVGSSNVTGANFGIKQNPADVLLLKRITAINGLTTNPNDNKLLTGALVDQNWKTGYVVGATDGGKVKPGDTIEYTIYYLNNGGRNANSARICDRLNANQTFQQNTYATGVGMQVQIGGDRITNTAVSLTNQSGDDGGQFITATAPVTALPTNCNSVSGAPNNDYGTLILDLVTSPGSPNLTTLPGKTSQGAPNNSFGFWRFVTKVKQASP